MRRLERRAAFLQRSRNRFRPPTIAESPWFYDEKLKVRLYQLSPFRLILIINDATFAIVPTITLNALAKSPELTGLERPSWYCVVKSGPRGFDRLLMLIGLEEANSRSPDVTSKSPSDEVRNYN
jgi:hypothetical protein